MVDHPLHELHDMKGELHANSHTRRAIILCAAVGIVALVLFLGLLPLFRAPALPVDPVAQGAASAFNVAEPSPIGAVDGTEPAVANTAAPEPVVIPPADLGGGNSGSPSGEPPVIYAPAAP